MHPKAPKGRAMVEDSSLRCKHTLACMMARQARLPEIALGKAWSGA